MSSFTKTPAKPIIIKANTDAYKLDETWNEKKFAALQLRSLNVAVLLLELKPNVSAIEQE
jgi:hypothetical protein